jgi:hypothetical protein
VSTTAPPAPPPGWMAPGNVRIEEVSGTGYGGFEPPPYPPRAYQDRAALQPEPSFQPMPPVETRRPRRMPEVEDFPQVGQRAYNATKAPARANDAGQQSSSGKPSEPRRGGWFSRFTRRAAAPSDSASSAALRPTSGQAHHSVRDGASALAPQVPQAGSGAANSKMQETPELPVFFGNRRR